MNYGAILAGGVGARMGNTKLPKQFLLLGKKPIIIHTIEQFVISEDIDKVIMAVPSNWLNYTLDIVKKYCKDENVFVITGGETRNETIMNICKFIDKEFSATEEDIIVTHDAVRPFITQRIIKENINECKKYGAVDTVVPAYDTIVEAKDGQIISDIPIRDYLYQGQTPQTFKVNELVSTYENLTDDEKKCLTDAAKMYVIKNKKVKLVLGELYNVKITTSYDLKLANLMLANKGEYMA